MWEVYSHRSNSRKCCYLEDVFASTSVSRYFRDFSDYQKIYRVRKMPTPLDYFDGVDSPTTPNQEGLQMTTTVDHDQPNAGQIPAKVGSSLTIDRNPLELWGVYDHWSADRGASKYLNKR